MNKKRKSRRTIGSNKLAGVMAGFVNRNVKTGESLVRSVPTMKK
jgi:hypothetical protein